MNAESRIRELVLTHLADDHQGGLVRFLDDLLALSGEVGEVRGTRDADTGLRFETTGQPAWVAPLGRAKTKLRMLCARLSVLCTESGSLQGTLYGGEGLILLNENTHPEVCPQSWKVSFMNTPSEHHFTITPVPVQVAPAHAQEEPVPHSLQQTGP